MKSSFLISNPSLWESSLLRFRLKPRQRHAPLKRNGVNEDDLVRGLNLSKQKQRPCEPLLKDLTPINPVQSTTDKGLCLLKKKQVIHNLLSPDFPEDLIFIRMIL